jgi:4-amino-4-deoxy-L-arabinose transferase-like glycosyltransferase
MSSRSANVRLMQMSTAPVDAVRRGRARTRWLCSDARALAVVLVSLAFGVALTWQRWGDPLIDCGREMNQPLRLLRGERLYGDISHFYGPLAPVLNGVLYRLFGASLDTLRGAGVAATLVILGATFWLARRLMGRAAAVLSAVSVTWLCALSLAGNYLLPYTYAAVYGTALSLLALVVGVGGLRSGRAVAFLASGLLTALAFLAKTEMGVAALAGGLACALLSGVPRWRATMWSAGVFLVPALGLPAATYVWIASQVGWTPLLDEGHLLYQNLAAPIVTFNRRMFGLDQPGRSALLVLAVALRLALLGSLLSWWALRRNAGSDVRAAHLGRLTATLAIAVFVISYAVGWEGGPYLAVPLLLLALIGFHARRMWRRRRPAGHARGSAAVVVALSVFALASLARMVLRVRSGGSYSSYLLPAAVIVFTYLWCALLPALMPATAARRSTRVAGLALLTCWVLGVAVVTVYRYRTQQTAELATPRGVMMTTPDRQRAFVEAMAFIDAHTQPGELVAVLPEGTSLLFFTDRRNPLHEEITVPGFLYEDRALQSLAERPVALVLIANRATPEYGPARFGVDYGQRLLAFIRERFVPCGRLGAPTAAGSLSFDAYCCR